MIDSDGWHEPSIDSWEALRAQLLENSRSETLSLEEAATFLRLGRKAMKELVDSGAVPAVRLNQKHTVMLREDLIAYLREEGRRQADARRVQKLKDAARAAKPRRSAKRPLPNLDHYDLYPSQR